MPSTSTKASGHELEDKSFPLNTRKHFSIVWVTEYLHILTRKAVKCPCFRSHLDNVPGNLLWLSMLEQVEQTTFRGPFQI